MSDKPRAFRFSTKKVQHYEFPTHVNDLVMDRAEADCSEVFIVVVPPGKGAPLHQHNDTEQIFYLLEGRGTLTVTKAGKRLLVAAGDVVRIPMKTPHRIQADKGVPVRYLCVDCFGSSRAKEEPTWDAHVRVICRNNGWDYADVIRKKRQAAAS